MFPSNLHSIFYLGENPSRGGGGGGNRPPLKDSRPPLKLKFRALMHKNKGLCPPIFHKYSFRPPLGQFLNENLTCIIER